MRFPVENCPNKVVLRKKYFAVTYVGYIVKLVRLDYLTYELRGCNGNLSDPNRHVHIPVFDPSRITWCHFQVPLSVTFFEILTLGSPSFQSVLKRVKSD